MWEPKELHRLPQVAGKAGVLRHIMIVLLEKLPGTKLGLMSIELELSMIQLLSGVIQCVSYARNEDISI